MLSGMSLSLSPEMPFTTTLVSVVPSSLSMRCESAMLLVTPPDDGSEPITLLTVVFKSVRMLLSSAKSFASTSASDMPETVRSIVRSTIGYVFCTTEDDGFVLFVGVTLGVAAGVLGIVATTEEVAAGVVAIGATLLG